MRLCCSNEFTDLELWYVAQTFQNRGEVRAEVFETCAFTDLVWAVPLTLTLTDTTCFSAAFVRNATQRVIAKEACHSEL